MKGNQAANLEPVEPLKALESLRAQVDQVLWTSEGRMAQVEDHQ